MSFPLPPTEKQLSYAKSLGVKMPEYVDRMVLSILIKKRKAERRGEAKWIVAVYVLAFVVVGTVLGVRYSRGQVSTDEAMQRLHDRQAHAATQPSQEVINEYKQIIAELRAENAKLKGQVSQLQSQLKDTTDAQKKSESAPPPEVVNDPAKLLHKGMTIAEANDALHCKFEITNSTPLGQSYSARVIGGTKQIAVSTPSPAAGQQRQFDFHVPPATSHVESKPWYWLVSIDVKDGTVFNYSCSKLPG